MDLKSNVVLSIISLVVMFAYQISIFAYTSSLLVNAIKSKVLFVVLATINTTLFAIYQMLSLPFYLLMIIFFIVLIIEFRLISKANFIQIFYGTSIFVLHISAFITPLVAIFANATQTPPDVLLDGTVYGYVVVIISCLFLMLAQEIVKKYIDNTSIQRVSTQGKYSTLLFLATAVVVAFQILHAMLIINSDLYIQQVYLTITVSLSSLTIFYLFFLYAIGLINANLYKRYSDNALSEQESISKQKEDLIRKAERDDLTGVYNRRFVMAVLDKMCEEEYHSNLFYVLFIDINGLKHTNDTYGHKAGDKLITIVSEAITYAVREDDIVARLGGDEFLVVTSPVNKPNCGDIVERIERTISKHNLAEEFLVSASIGSVMIDKDMQKKGSSYILSIADENMRKNKERFYAQRKGG